MLICVKRSAIREERRRSRRDKAECILGATLRTAWQAARRAASSSVHAPSVTLCGTAALRVRERTGALTNQPASAPRMCTRLIVQNTTHDHGREHQRHRCKRCILVDLLVTWRSQGRLDFSPPGRCLFGGLSLSGGTLAIWCNVPLLWL